MLEWSMSSFTVIPLAQGPPLHRPFSGGQGVVKRNENGKSVGCAVLFGPQGLCNHLGISRLFSFHHLRSAMVVLDNPARETN